MLKYAVLILWRKKGIAVNFYAFCISANRKRLPLKRISARSLRSWRLLTRYIDQVYWSVDSG